MRPMDRIPGLMKGVPHVNDRGTGRMFVGAIAAIPSTLRRATGPSSHGPVRCSTRNVDDVTYLRSLHKLEILDWRIDQESDW